MVYTNIIEQLGDGRSAEQIRSTIGGLDLVPASHLPNPNVPALLEQVFMKIARYRNALVEVIRRFGGELLNELEFEFGLITSVGVNVGFPPSVSIAVEHTASTQAITRY